MHTSFPFRRVAAAAITLVAFGACGGSDDKDPVATGASVTTTTAEPGASADGAAPTTTAKKSTAKPPAGSPDKGGTPAAAPTTAPGQTFAQQQSSIDSQLDDMMGDLAFEATLGKTCVTTGGAQTIEIKAPPDSAVGYDSYYADGKSGLHEGFYGGNHGGNVDETGVWSHTWTISPTAPAGTVTVRILAADPEGTNGHKRIDFKLAKAGESC